MSSEDYITTPLALPLFELSEITSAGNFPAKMAKGKVVIYRKVNGRYEFLFGKESYGKTQETKCNLLGGTCNKNESILNCAARELFEETIGIIQENVLLRAIYEDRKSSVIKYNYKNENGGKMHVFVFFVNLRSLDISSKELFNKFDQRRKLLGEILNKKTFTDSSREVLKNALGISKPAKLVSKSYIKHFYEIYKLCWLPTSELSNVNCVTGITREIQFIRSQRGNKIIKESVSDFLNFKKPKTSLKGVLTEWTLIH